MAGDAALRAEVASDPAGLGLSWSLTDQQIHTLLHALSRPRRVPLGEIEWEMNNMADAEGTPVWELINQQIAATTAVGVAARAAMALAKARVDHPDIDTHSPVYRGQLDVLQTAGILTTAQATRLKDLGDNAISRAAELGLTARMANIANARALP